MDAKTIHAIGSSYSGTSMKRKKKTIHKQTNKQTIKKALCFATGHTPFSDTNVKKKLVC